MQLHDVRIEIAGKAGNSRRLVVGHRHDHVRGVERKIPCPDDVAVALALDALDPGACVHGQLKSYHIGFEVVGHLVLGRKGPAGRRKRHAVEAVVAGRREQAQRVPAAAPGIADPFVGFEDHEGDIVPLQMIADGQAGLAAADHHDVDTLRLRR